MAKYCIVGLSPLPWICLDKVAAYTSIWMPPLIRYAHFSCQNLRNHRYADRCDRRLCLQRQILSWHNDIAGDNVSILRECYRIIGQRSLILTLRFGRFCY